MDGNQREQIVNQVKLNKQAKIDLYDKLLHSVQTGIAWTIAFDNPDVFDINGDPNLRAHKHLRVGIDSAKSDHGALVKLLIDKKLINEDEYYDYLIEFMQREKHSYEEMLSEKLSKKITLE